MSRSLFSDSVTYVERTERGLVFTKSVKGGWGRKRGGGKERGRRRDAKGLMEKKKGDMEKKKE